MPLRRRELTNIEFARYRDRTRILQERGFPMYVDFSNPTLSGPWILEPDDGDLAGEGESFLLFYTQRFNRIVHKIASFLRDQAPNLEKDITPLLEYLRRTQESFFQRADFGLPELENRLKREYAFLAGDTDRVLIQLYNERTEGKKVVRGGLLHILFAHYQKFYETVDRKTRPDSIYPPDVTINELLCVLVDLLRSGNRIKEGKDLKIEKRYRFPSGAYESEEEPQHQKQRLILTPYREYHDGSRAENGGDDHKHQPHSESRSDAINHTKGPPLWTIKSAYPVEREER